jgi:hypothetical protein
MATQQTQKQPKTDVPAGAPSDYSPVKAIQATSGSHYGDLQTALVALTEAGDIWVTSDGHAWRLLLRGGLPVAADKFP